MSAADESAVRELIAAADAAFAAGDADRWADLFAPDGRNLPLHREELAGREVIRQHWRGSFPRFDTSAWEPTVDTIEIHGDDAYAYTTYTERLLERATGQRTLVRGRLIWFLRRLPDEGWRIRLLMNSHSHPMEPIT